MNKKLSSILDQAEDFPALPHVTFTLFQMTNKPDVSLQAITKVIASDASMSSRILKMVNSGYFQLEHEITDLKQAVSILGIKTIRDISITLSINDIFPSRNSEEYSYLFKQSLCTAVAADYICKFTSFHRIRSQAFVAGNLLNIGRFILMRYMSSEYIKIIREARERCIDLGIAEKSHLGISSSEAGAIIAERWKLPATIVSAIKYQNDISEIYHKNYPQEVIKTIEITYLSGLIAEIFTGWDKAHKIAQFRRHFIRIFEEEHSTATEILKAVPQFVKSLGGSFYDFALLPSFNHIKHLADKELEHSYKVFNKTYLEMIHLKKEQKKVIEKT